MAVTNTTTQRITGGSGYTDADLDALEKRIEEANAQLKTFNTTAASDEALRNRAESEYRPVYNAQVAEHEAAKQSAQSTLDATMGALNRQYERDAESLNRSYDTQLARTNNAMLARGFNNSSLAVAMLNQANAQRNRALDTLAAERAAGESSAQAAYNNAVSAADAAIGRLGSDLATNVDARYQALREAEQNRLFQQIQAQNQLEQLKMDWEFDLAQMRRQAYNNYIANSTGSSNSGSGSSGRYSSSGSTGSGAGTDTKPSSSLADMFNRSNATYDNSGAGNQISGTKAQNLLNQTISGAKKKSTSTAAK